MAHNFMAPERDQLYLLPPSMADWLDEDYLAFFIPGSAVGGQTQGRFPGVSWGDVGVGAWAACVHAC